MKYVITILLCMFITGCAITHVESVKSDGSYIQGYAVACFGAEQKGISGTGENWEVEMKGQTSEAEAMLEFIKLGVEIGRAGK